MQKQFILLALLLTTLTSFAQTEEESLEKIRSVYYDIQERMEVAMTTEYPEFYVVKKEENALNSSMPGVGDYYGKTEKWYVPDEANMKFHDDGILVFKKCNFRVAGRARQEEYVFDDGKLIFCLIKTGGGEYRYYFMEDKLIKFAEKQGDEQIYKKEDWKLILEHAKS